MDLITLTKKYVDYFDNKNIQEIGKLMSDEFHLTDGEVIELAPKQAVLTYIDGLMRANSKRFQFQMIDVFGSGNRTVLEFNLYLDDSIYHGVDVIFWSKGLMTKMKAFVNEVTQP